MPHGVALKRDRHLTESRHRSQLPTRTDRNVKLTARVVASFVSNHSVPVSELPGLIDSTYRAFAGLERIHVARRGREKSRVDQRMIRRMTGTRKVERLASFKAA